MLAKYILSELENPSNWELQDNCVLKHLKSGQKLWMCAGKDYVDTWPKTGCFTASEKKALWEKFGEMRNKVEADEKRLEDAKKLIKKKEIIKAWGLDGTESANDIADTNEYDTESPKTTKLSKVSEFLKKFKIKLVYK